MTLVETPPTGHGRARGLVSSRQSGSRIDAHTYAPPADLAEVVECFWDGCWELPAEAPHETLLLSDPCVHLAFERGGPYAGARVVGVWTRLWRRTLEGRGSVRAVKLRAGALRAFAEVRACDLRNRIVPLEEVFGRDARAPARALLEVAAQQAAFAALADWLRRLRRPQERERVGLAVALVERIAHDSELTSVEQLAEVAGLGPRALQRLFRDYVGASPKWVIRRNRLQEVALRLERGDGPSLAALAAQLGYSDQAHLAHDFKAAVGKSPSDFAASI